MSYRSRNEDEPLEVDDRIRGRHLCKYCREFYISIGRICTQHLGECDCPRCQGVCECGSRARPTAAPFNPPRRKGK